MLNPFFLNGTKTEQNLIQDLINEQIQMYGIEVYYLPRQYITEKTVIKEVIESKFDFAYPIEVYLDTYDGYGGQGTILSKFGIQELDDLTLIMSKDRFQVYISPLMKNLPNIGVFERPREGDLIYFPLGDRIFEIKYVENEKPFYQLRENYVYELKCELFRYEDESIDTSIDFIDDNISGIGPIQTLQMVSLGSTCIAETTVNNGSVTSVSIINRGYEYKTAPIIKFSSPKIIPSNYELGTAVGVSTLISGISDFCDSNINSYRIQGIELINPGFGYTVAPKISFSGGGGRGATAVSNIGNGVLGKIQILDPGYGYVKSPTVSFIGTCTSPAIANAIVSEDGKISSIRFISAGIGYTEPPEIVVSPPDIIEGTGTYQYNEIVVGEQSNVSATVKLWNHKTNILEVSIITGSFIEGERLIGQKSGASYILKTINDMNISDPEDETNLKDPYADNLNIQAESNLIIDFSEKNPFGMP